MNKHIFSLLLIALFFCLTSKASSGMLSEEKTTVNREQSDEWATLWVNYHGRICPLQTLAIDFTTKLTGKPKYQDTNAEQFLLGWLFFPQKWYNIPIFEIKHPDLQKLINLSGIASYSDFFDADNFYKLEIYWKEMYRSEQQTALAKEASKLDEKIQLITMLRQGSLLKLFPLQTENKILQWFSPSNILPDSIDSMTNIFVQNFFSLYDEYIDQNNPKEALQIIQGLHRFQQKNAASVLPMQTHLQAELINNKIPVFSLLFKVNLTIGSIGIFLFLFYMIRKKNIRKISRLFYGLLIVSFLILTAGLFLRGYIAGRLPMSNGYETMLIVAWSALLVGLILRKQLFLMTVFSFLLSGFALLVAHIGSMNPQITPLVPVLQSPLLSIHVSFIMVAYGLCGFMLLNSLTSFSLLAFGKKNPQTTPSVNRMKEMSELFMFPATFFMGAGIFIGAIWANVSWGRYWGWDPKEVWALITFLLMSFTFHGRTLSWFKRPFFYHLFVLLIFASVLMTYFGVNYILGGKHSYAGG